MKKLTYFLCK
jgi:hypothetical protein